MRSNSTVPPSDINLKGSSNIKHEEEQEEEEEEEEIEDNNTNTNTYLGGFMELLFQPRDRHHFSGGEKNQTGE